MYKSKWLPLILVLTMLFLSLAPPITYAASRNSSSGPSAQPPSAVKDSKAPASFTFQLTVTGLTVAPQDNGSFALKDAKSGDTKFVIPRSYMYDHKQKTSQAVTTSMTPPRTPTSIR